MKFNYFILALANVFKYVLLFLTKYIIYIQVKVDLGINQEFDC